MTPVENSLVLYKSFAARIKSIGDKFEIELENGETKRVRPKDILLIHPGPLGSFSDLTGQKDGEVSEAWEMLIGVKTNLAELSELVFGDYTPVTAWASWKIVQDGLFFEGQPDEIRARSREQVEAERKTRAEAEAEKLAWTNFLERVKQRKTTPADRNFVLDVEAVANGKASRCKLLETLGSQVTAENAHSTLLKLGFWDETQNPHPKRHDLPTKSPETPFPVFSPEFFQEERVDLTYLPAFAIDDEGNTDPDDALSLDGERLWVHVADIASVIHPDSPLDLDSRGFGASIYLPEKKVPMLPDAATLQFGLGIQEKSPSLSFGIVLDEAGEIADINIVRAWVKVTRTSYEAVDGKMNSEPFCSMERVTNLFRQRRKKKSSAQIELPEVKIQVSDGEIHIRRLAALRSRQLVAESMLLAGESAARFAIKNHIPLPYTTQSPPEVALNVKLETLSEMFAYRKKMKRSQMKSAPEPHSGLGLDAYVRATSPLRRYLDLVVHQQLRSFLRGEQMLGGQEVLTRVGAAESVLGNVRRAERSSNLHWTLVYLKRRPDWRGKGVLVDRYGAKNTVLVPELGLEAKLFLTTDLPLNSEVDLKVASIDLPFLDITMTFA
jgi:exoribonuclease II